MAAPIVLLVALIWTGTLEVERVAYLRAQCTSCGMTTNLLYYRLSLGSWSADIPYGMAVYGGTSYCPHTLVYP